MHAADASEASVAPRGQDLRGWPRWAPKAAVAWSLLYAALGVYWAAGGRGFPDAATASDGLGPLIGRFGPGVAWTLVAMAGIPAAGIGAAMLCGVRGRALRPLFIAGGALVGGALLLLMTGLTLLVLLGYVPYVIVDLLTGGEVGRKYLKDLTRWPVVHQLICLVGGFLWVAATVSYSRRSGDACLSCGRRDGPEGWRGADRAARWGRTAVYLSTVAPIFYALTRCALPLGFTLGMSQANLSPRQVTGMWISGLFLAAFGLVGVVLTFGLVQRWGEVFPRWMIGVRGRRVPIALAVVPAALVSVLLVVGGIVVWSHLPTMVARLAGRGAEGMRIVGAILFALGPVLLFPLWGAALAAAALAYYYRRRVACRACGRGGVGESAARQGFIFLNT